jgi:hypothetical protein
MYSKDWVEVAGFAPQTHARRLPSRQIEVLG